MSELQQALNSKRPGDKATVTYIRHKKEISKDYHTEECTRNDKGY